MSPFLKSGTLPAIAVTLALALFPMQLAAKTYHVDQSRGTDESPGTQSEPFRTVTQASKVLKPGDTAVLHEGVYHEQIMGGESGLEGAPIVYEGTNREKVILQGSVRVTDWRKSGNTWVKRGLNPITHENSYVMVDERKMLKKVGSPLNLPEGSYHLDPSGTYTIRLWKDTDPNNDHRVEVYELDLGFNGGARWGGTAKKWIVLRNLTIEKYGSLGVSTDFEHSAANSHWELDRITSRLNHGSGVFACLDDWYVHDCTFTRNGSHGCQIDGARVRFLNNLSTENEWFFDHVDGGCGVIIGPSEIAHSCLVKNNTFTNNGNKDGYGCGIYLEGMSHHNRIENNTIVGNTHAGIGFYGSSFNIVCTNLLSEIAPTSDWDMAAAFVVGHSYEGPPTQSMGNLVAHNTVWGCPAPIAVFKPVEPIPNDKRNRFVNNLFVRYRFLSPLPASPGVLIEGNAWFSPDSATIRGIVKWLKNALGDFGDRKPLSGTDPGMVDPKKGDFRLKADSPLIDAGVPLSEVTHDRADNPRSCGKGPDIGAYEFCGGKGDEATR